MLKQGKAWIVTNYAVMFATTFVAMMIDRFVISWVLPISTANCVLLVTFVFCFVYNKWHFGVMSGLFFGLSSMIKSFIPLLADVVNQNPLVSVLPRIVALTVAFGAYRLVVWLLKNHKSAYARQTVAVSIATFFGLLTNTLLYLTALNLYKQATGDAFGNLWVIIKGVLYTNILPEYLISIIFVPHIIIAVRRGMRLGMEANYAQQQESVEGSVNTAEVEKTD